MTKIDLDPGRTAKTLGTIVALLFMAHLICLYSIFYLGDGDLYGFVRLFDLDEEPNIPTFYSALALLFAALILAAIASSKRRAEDRFALHWAGLSLIFLFLAFDEGAMIHEQIGVLLTPHLNTAGLFYYRWIIPYGVLTLVVFGLLVRFLLDLPVKTRNLFLTAGLIYVTGALGFEAFQGRLDELDTRREIEQRQSGLEVVRDEASYAAYGILATAEELFEMIGIVLFIYALLAYADTELNGVTVAIQLGQRREPD